VKLREYDPLVNEFNTVLALKDILFWFIKLKPLNIGNIILMVAGGCSK
jgi:hypothetical protein